MTLLRVLTDLKRKYMSKTLKKRGFEGLKNVNATDHQRPKQLANCPFHYTTLHYVSLQWPLRGFNCKIPPINLFKLFILITQLHRVECGETPEMK